MIARIKNFNKENVAMGLIYRLMLGMSLITMFYISLFVICTL